MVISIKKEKKRVPNLLIFLKTLKNYLNYFYSLLYHFQILKKDFIIKIKLQKNGKKIWMHGRKNGILIWLIN